MFCLNIKKKNILEIHKKIRDVLKKMNSKVKTIQYSQEKVKL